MDENPDTESTQITTSTSKSSLTPRVSKVKRKIFLIPALIVIVVAAIIAGLLISGMVYAGIKKPAQKTQLVYQVCGNDVIDKYNQIHTQRPETESENQKYEQDFNNLAKVIQERADSDKDPTCQYMLFSNFQRQGDTSNMRRTASLIVKLNEDGQYINGKINVELYSTSTLLGIIDGKE
jgi:hypothetical protein